MRRRSVQFVLVLPLIVAVGLPWIALQSAAWAGMMADYARTLSLSEAAAKTFDGNDPCDLCLAAARGQTSEDAPGSTSPGARFEWMPHDASFSLSAPIVSTTTRRPDVPPTRGAPPPTPPPPEQA